MRYVCGILFLACLSLAAQAADPGDSPSREVAAFRLDMPFVQHLAGTAADMKAYLKAHPDLAKQTEDEAGEEHSLDQAIANLEKVPAFNSILKKNNLTARQYVLGSLALMQAGIGAWAVQQRGEQTWDKLKAKGVNTDNVHFYIDHKAELDKVTAAMQTDDDGG